MVGVLGFRLLWTSPGALSQLTVIHPPADASSRHRLSLIV
jgi:hypothetical protein